MTLDTLILWITDGSIEHVEAMDYHRRRAERERIRVHQERMRKSYEALEAMLEEREASKRSAA
jgi:hypothetical protein